MAKLIAVLLAVGIPLLWGVGMYHLFERWRRGNKNSKAADSGAAASDSAPEERGDD